MIKIGINPIDAGSQPVKDSSQINSWKNRPQWLKIQIKLRKSWDVRWLRPFTATWSNKSGGNGPTGKERDRRWANPFTATYPSNIQRWWQPRGVQRLNYKHNFQIHAYLKEKYHEKRRAWSLNGDSHNKALSKYQTWEQGISDKKVKKSNFWKNLNHRYWTCRNRKLHATCKMLDLTF